MKQTNLKEFGNVVTRLINKESLNRQETFDAFNVVLNNETTDIQQGAFLAAMSAKGETKDEIAGCQEAIYQFDTTKVTPMVEGPIVENSGTGMDSFKTFNISTAASVVAACGGVTMARHGARALTSQCGTVDLAEALGVDVECEAEMVKQSVERSGIGLFNGMSPNIHPMALGRILSQMSFGSMLNIAASLASPVKATHGVRGVYSSEMLLPATQVMREIGYERAIVIHGSILDDTRSMDEASVCGETLCAELTKDGHINEFTLFPEDVGLHMHRYEELAAGASLEEEAKRFVNLLHGNESQARIEVVALNAAFIFYCTGKSNSIEEGVNQSLEIIHSKKAISTLKAWVQAQNRDAEKGLLKLSSLGVN